MARLQIHSQLDEGDVRSDIAAALLTEGGEVVTNEPGYLVIEVGSVGKAFLAGPFRSTTKMPIEIMVTTTSSKSGTSVVVEVGSHGTGGGFLSGGLIGVARQRKAEQLRVEKVGATVRGQVVA